MLQAHAQFAPYGVYYKPGKIFNNPLYTAIYVTHNMGKSTTDYYCTLLNTLGPGQNGPFRDGMSLNKTIW